MPKESPDWMQQRAKKIEEAGGQSSYEAQKFAEEIAKIKPEQWKGLNETFKTIKSYLDMEVGGAMSTMVEGVVETARLKFEETLSPLKNEINGLINQLLEPILPMIAGLVEFLVPIIGSIASWVQGIIDFLFAPTIEMGGYEFESFTTFSARTGGSHRDYVTYLNDIVVARRTQEARTARRRAIQEGQAQPDPHTRAPSGRVIEGEHEGV